MIISEPNSTVALSPADVLHLQKSVADDEPIYLTKEEMPAPPPAPVPPTLEQIARKAAEYVVEMQSKTVVPDNAPVTKARKVKKTVIRDANNRIEAVIEEEI